MAETNKLLVKKGAFLVDELNDDGKRYGFYRGIGAVTNSSGLTTLTAPAGYTCVDITAEATTKGTSAVFPTISVADKTVDFGGSSTTTFNYSMLVSK